MSVSWLHFTASVAGRSIPGVEKPAELQGTHPDLFLPTTRLLDPSSLRARTLWQGVRGSGIIERAEQDPAGRFSGDWRAGIAEDLMKLIGYERIGTTIRFYVGQNAQRTAGAAYAAYELAQARQQAGERQALPTLLSTVRPRQSPRPRQKTTQAPASQGLVRTGE